MALLEVLVLGSYAFTAGAYIFAWHVYRSQVNHRRTELKRHLRDECDSDCYYCDE